MKVVVPLVVAVLLVGAVVQMFWWLVAAAAVYGTYRLARNHGRRHRARAAAADHELAQLLARAELQHRWFLEGDPRGLYGRYPPAVVAAVRQRGGNYG